MAYGFSKRSTAEQAIRIAKNGASEFSSRRRTQGVPLAIQPDMPFYRATPDGEIPGGTQQKPAEGKAFLLVFNPQSGELERASRSGVDLGSLDVLNPGPKIVPIASEDEGEGEGEPTGSVFPIIELQGVSNGGLWVNVCQKLKFGRTLADVNFGDTFEVAVYRGGEDTGERVMVVWDWFKSNQNPIEAGTDISFNWICDEGLYRLVGADCDAGGSQ